MQPELERLNVLLTILIIILNLVHTAQTHCDMRLPPQKSYLRCSCKI